MKKFELNGLGAEYIFDAETAEEAFAMFISQSSVNLDHYLDVCKDSGLVPFTADDMKEIEE